jgi:hypothetical protein
VSNHDVAAGSLLCIGVVVAFCVVFALEARNIRRIEAAGNSQPTDQGINITAAADKFCADIDSYFDRVAAEEARYLDTELWLETRGDAS